MPSQEVRKEGCWPVLLPFQAFPPSDIDADDRRVTTDTQSPPMEDGSQGAGSPCTAIVQAEPVPPPRPQQALGPPRGPTIEEYHQQVDGALEGLRIASPLDGGALVHRGGCGPGKRV